MPDSLILCQRTRATRAPAAGPAAEDAALGEEELEAGAWGEAELDLGEDGEPRGAAEPFADAEPGEDGEDGEGGWEMEARARLDPP